MTLPVFVDATVSFTLNGKSFRLPNTPTSIWGVHGIEWDSLSPKECFGKGVDVAVEISGQPPLTIQAIVTREETQKGGSMSLHFRLTDAQRKTLSELVLAEGHPPKEYTRRFPRVPVTPSIQTFPLRAIIHQVVDGTEVGAPIIGDVGNLSPNGILLTTQNSQALSLGVGTTFTVILEPRGGFSHAVKIEALVCRTIDDVDAASKNVTRSFGCQFMAMDDFNRQVFGELLKDILSRVREKKPNPAG